MAKDEERIANDDFEKLIPNFFRCANQESPKKLNLREHSQGGNACAYCIKSHTMVTPELSGEIVFVYPAFLENLISLEDFCRHC